MSKGKTTERSGKLIKDIGIYAIGNLGSKLIMFLLVPLYTFYISPIDYGYYDICLTAIFILIPFLSFQLRDGAFRFLMEADGVATKRAIITFTYRTLIQNSVIALIISGILGLFYNFEYMWLLVWLLIFMSFYEVIIQIVRGLGNTSFFVLSGIISTFLVGILSILFVVWMKIGIEGIFYANILSRLLTLILIELKLKIGKRFLKYRFNNKEINKEIIRYSLPLLPGTICWWLVGSSNRFFIEHFLGLDENGIYAVALKFISILETLAIIFYQAWQETAIKQYTSPDRDRFFSGVMNNYIYVLTILVIFIPFIIKLNYFWLVGKEYQESSMYLFPLALSAMFFALAAFFDMGYQCSKCTIYTLPGIVLASLINIVGNYFLIQEYKIYGIIASSVLTFFSLFIYRIIDTRRFFKIKYNHLSIELFILIAISGIVYYTIENPIIIIAYLILSIGSLFYFAPTSIKNMITNKIIRRH